MDGVVSFNYDNWALRYPELAQYVEDQLAQLYFNEACMYCDNTATSPIADWSVGGQRDILLGMVTAHIAALNAPLGAPSTPLVGRIASAGQGSVNVTTQNDYPAGSVQWFQQTKYGAAFWGATKRYRRFIYVKGCTRNMDPYSFMQGRK
jgi:hypothetical protein